MRENRDQSDLLRNPQDHLKKVGGPSGEKSSRAAWNQRSPRYLAAPGGTWLFDQDRNLSDIGKALSAQCKDVDSFGAASNRSLCRSTPAKSSIFDDTCRLAGRMRVPELLLALCGRRSR
jgi:hypothetical protein